MLGAKVRMKYTLARVMVLCLMGGGVAMLAFWLLRRQEVQWLSVLSVRLSPEETVEYGWERHWQTSWGRHPTYLNAVVWHRPGKTRRFLVYNGGDKPAPIELRATEDLIGLWLVERRHKERQIVASLDRSSGEFLSLNQIPMDWHLSLSRQAELEGSWAYKQKPYPSWATPTGGILLAAEPRP